MKPSIDALLFDVGRVIIDIDSKRVHRRWAELSGVPVEQIAARILARVAGQTPFERHERGEISDSAFFAHLRSELEVELTDAQFLEGWNAIFIGEMPGIRRVLSLVRDRLPLYAFSNTNKAHHAHWAISFGEVLGQFRKVYVSHEIGARKPEIEAFQLVLADMGIAPERVLFFDDVAENVAAARACGLNAAQVASAAEVEAALREANLAGPSTSSAAPRG